MILQEEYINCTYIKISFANPKFISLLLEFILKNKLFSVGSSVSNSYSYFGVHKKEDAIKIKKHLALLVTPLKSSNKGVFGGFT